MISSRPSPDPEPHRTLYGRRKGRPLGKRQRELFSTLLPALELVLPAQSPVIPPSRLNIGDLFPRSGIDRHLGLGLEIGFGGGEHLLSQALRCPRMGFIGCEPYANGVAKLLASIDGARAEGAPVNNIVICREDGRALLSALPDQSLSIVFLLFPDPWPKLRHHKRRIVTPETVGGLARTLSDGAELRVATDHPEYCRWILHHVLSHTIGGAPAFRCLAESLDDCRRRPPGWPETRYEAKAKTAGRPCRYLRFKRLSRSPDFAESADFGDKMAEKS